MFGLSSIRAINAAWATNAKKRAAAEKRAKAAEARAKKARAVESKAALNRYLQDNDQ